MCTRCRLSKPYAEFYKPQSLEGRYMARCKQCVREVNEANRLNNRERDAILRRAGVLRRRYGITLEQWSAQRERQHGRCAACHKPERVKVRGVLRSLGVHMPELGGRWDLRCHHCLHAEHFARMTGATQ